MRQGDMGCERSSGWRPPKQPLAPEVVLRTSGPLRPPSYKRMSRRVRCLTPTEPRSAILTILVDVDFKLHLRRAPFFYIEKCGAFVAPGYQLCAPLCAVQLCAPWGCPRPRPEAPSPTWLQNFVPQCAISNTNTCRHGLRGLVV